MEKAFGLFLLIAAFIALSIWSNDMEEDAKNEAQEFCKKQPPHCECKVQMAVGRYNSRYYYCTYKYGNKSFIKEF